MSLLKKILNRNVSPEKQGFVVLDSLGLIYPRTEYELYRPIFVVMDFDGYRYDEDNYRYLDGKKCKKYREYIPCFGTVKSPEYSAIRYLDTLIDLKKGMNNSTMSLNDLKELEIDDCPLTLYIKEQFDINKEFDVRKMQIPMKILNDSYEFFDKKILEYRKKRLPSKAIFIK